MFIAERLEEILLIVKAPFIALWLYGSQARGDAEEESDIDILQITPAHTGPYSVGRYNITCYTIEQLLRMARESSLFARHLAAEAKPLSDPADVLGSIRIAYVAPPNYNRVKKEARDCAPLLVADPTFFTENAAGLCSLVCYLLRTYLYALAFEQGAESFSMVRVLELLDQRKAADVLARAREGSYPAFLAARYLYQDLSGADCVREEGSLEAFIVNAYGSKPLAVVLGLRLLARGRPFTYDAIMDLA